MEAFTFTFTFTLNTLCRDVTTMYLCNADFLEEMTVTFSTSTVSSKENLSDFFPWDLPVVKISPEWITGPEQGNFLKITGILNNVFRPQKSP